MKRWMGLLLAATMLLTLFAAGCSGEAQPESASVQEETKQTEAVMETAAESKAETQAESTEPETGAAAGSALL